MLSNAKLLSVGMMAMGLSACAGVGTAGRGGTEVRGMASILAESPRAIAEGPVHLLHVDVHGQQAVTLFSVVRRSGTDRDCLASGATGRSMLAHDRRTTVDVEVPDGQVVCLARADAGRGASEQRIDVSWHARREGGLPAGTLALDTQDR